MSLTLIFATRNRHKVEEVAALMPGQFKLLSMQEAGVDGDIPETGSTIKENSILKAKHLHEMIVPAGQVAIIAEDSGLEVVALNGAPGVFSARYAGGEKSDRANNDKLLSELRQTNSRKARFVTVITLIHQGEIHTFEGEVQGTIAHESRGTSGFGYDPLFIPTGYRSTFAELGMDVKNSISHRAVAVKKLVEFLTKR